MISKIIICFVAIFLYLYYKLTKNKNYWKDRGIPSTKFHFFWGNDKESLQGKKSRHEILTEEYFNFPGERFYGRWATFGTPQLVIRDDFDLIRSVWIKDFDQFNQTLAGHAFSKMLPTSREEKLILSQVQNVHGEAWKQIRSLFTPIFTSGKLKQMLPLLQDLNKQIESYIVESSSSIEDLELKALMGKFSMAALASCAFGVDSGSFTNKEKPSEFVENARKIFEVGDFWSLISRTIAMVTPKCVKKLFSDFGFKNTPPIPSLNEQKFFQNVVEATIRQRKESGMKRNDLVDLMIAATEGNLDSTDNSEQIKLNSGGKNGQTRKVGNAENYDDVISTAVILLIAGYDTTGTTMSYILHELAMNQDLQETLYEEIQNAKDLSYDTIQSLPYLDAVIHETLRRHPVVATLDRPCSTNYKIPNSNLVLEKGLRIRVNNVGICNDPNIFLKPEEWNPENFLKENRGNRNPYSFMAFSLGPRNCIAMRFAMFEMKVAISHLISKFLVLPTSKTCKNVRVDPKHVLGAAKGGLWVKFEERN